AAPTWMPSRASVRSKAFMKSTMRRASAVLATGPRKKSAGTLAGEANERARTRPDHARAHRDRDHDGIPDGVYADGPWHVLRLHRVLRPRTGVPGEQDLLPDGRAHIRRDDERDAVVDTAVRIDGLRNGTRGACGQDVLQHPACVS